MNNLKYLTKTRHKIAILTSLVTAFFVLLTSVTLIIIFRVRLDIQGSRYLYKEISKLQVEIETNQVKDVDLKLKENQYTRLDYVQNRVLSNIAMESGKIENPSEIDIQKLEESKYVFSKVIDGKGDITLNSELFENYVIDPERTGFIRHDLNPNTCVYSYTYKVKGGAYDGYTIQVANFCTLSEAEMGIYLALSIVVTIALTLTTYSAGYILSKMILKPVSQNIEKSRNFARTVRHELLTPLTVALSSIEAALETKKYKEGLESSKEDLVNSLRSLELLGNYTPQDEEFERIDFSKILTEEISQLERFVKGKNSFHLTADSSLSLKANHTGAKIIIRNILENASKYSPFGSEIQITLDSKRMTVANQIDSKVDGGMGIGLSIVREICTFHKWQLVTTKKGERFIGELKF